MKEKKIGPAVAALSIACVCLSVISVALAWFCFQSRLYTSKMETQVTALQKEKLEQQKQITALQTQVEQLQNAIDETETHLAEEDSKEGQLEKPVQETSVLQVQELSPGEILDESQVAGKEDTFFTIDEIFEGDPIYQRILGKSYQENPNIGLSDLRYLKMLHYNFSGEIQVGEMIVNARIAEDVVQIFKELYRIKYQIESMYLIDNYWAGDGDSSDFASIDVNNTSCFNYRPVTGGSNLSNHAYGVAIDLNPQQNPYVWYTSDGNPQWSHRNADSYINRDSGDPHVIVAGDPCYQIFSKYGFTWGGNWNNPKDYQHFEKRIFG